ncbi:MAG: type III pantothenate kinase [Candidatus Omnitrophica bacterium]|nr:type III pantothenate kinase [Candidatus Omnitrophota bacterium]
MNIFIDIGNTSTVFGFSKKKNNYAVLRIKTESISDLLVLKKETAAYLKKIKAKAEQIDNFVICSVVPKAQTGLKKQLNKIFPKAGILCIGRELKVKIKNKYRIPEQVGLDRLVNALAVKENYSLPALVVDFGTTITIDLVSEKAEYLGGVIIPGINLSLFSLHHHTALLPRLSAKMPKALLGRDTDNSILSGVFNGYACLIDGLIDKFKQDFKLKFKQPIKVIATGGHLYLMKKLCNNIDVYDSALTLKGIEKAYLKSQDTRI